MRLRAGTCFSGVGGLIVRDVGLLFDLFDNGLVTVSNLGLIRLVEVDGLSQGKEMFLAIVADQ